MLSKLALAAALSASLLTRVAVAEGEEDDSPTAHVMDLPEDCRQFAMVPAGADDIAGWNQVLSLASCMQDTSTFEVRRVTDIPDRVDELSRRMIPALAIYLDAIEHAPVSVQLSATYHIGLAQLAMVTRARASIPTPADYATNPRAAARHRKLQAELDERLDPMLKIAWMAFMMLDTVAQEHPELVADPVSAANVAFARRMLAQLPDPNGPQTVLALR